MRRILPLTSTSDCTDIDLWLIPGTSLPSLGDWRCSEPVHRCLQDETRLRVQKSFCCLENCLQEKSKKGVLKRQETSTRWTDSSSWYTALLLGSVSIHMKDQLPHTLQRTRYSYCFSVICFVFGGARCCKENVNDHVVGPIFLFLWVSFTTMSTTMTHILIYKRLNQSQPQGLL